MFQIIQLMSKGASIWIPPSDSRLLTLMGRRKNIFGGAGNIIIKRRGYRLGIWRPAEPLGPGRILVLSVIATHPLKVFEGGNTMVRLAG